MLAVSPCSFLTPGEVPCPPDCEEKPQFPEDLRETAHAPCSTVLFFFSGQREAAEEKQAPMAVWAGFSNCGPYLGPYLSSTF